MKSSNKLKWNRSRCCAFIQKQKFREVFTLKIFSLSVARIVDSSSGMKICRCGVAQMSHTRSHFSCELIFDVCRKIVYFRFNLFIQHLAEIGMAFRRGLHAVIRFTLPLTTRNSCQCERENSVFMRFCFMLCKPLGAKKS